MIILDDGMKYEKIVRRFVPVVRDFSLTQRHIAGPIGYVESNEPVDYFVARIKPPESKEF